MKKIIMALAIAAFAYSGAEAQVCKTQSVVKHRSVVKSNYSAVKQVNTPPLETQKMVQQSCQVVPFDVCTINPDRRSVTCVKTVDPEATDPALSMEELKTYGETGDVPTPGQAKPSGVETIVLKGQEKGDYCKRNEANDATICYHNGDALLTRDEQGFYHYK